MILLTSVTPVRLNEAMNSLVVTTTFCHMEESPQRPSSHPSLLVSFTRLRKLLYSDSYGNIFLFFSVILLTKHASMFLCFCSLCHCCNIHHSVKGKDIIYLFVSAPLIQHYVSEIYLCYYA